MQKHIYKQTHIPVLAEEVLTYLDPKSGESYLDLTAGYGGHAKLVLKKTKPSSETQAILIDRDQAAVESLIVSFSEWPVQIIQSDYLSAAQQLKKNGQTFDLILADLGLSSVHLNEAQRGFAIAQTGPLDMRMDQNQNLTAEQIVNNYSEDQLTKLLKDNAEEPKARKIAQAITKNRPIRSTTELADIVKRATRWGRSKVHPATRTFQALRMTVNDELALLEQALPIWIDLLKPGGRLAVISFHSLEDRLVKDAFRERAGNRYDAELQILTKSLVTADPKELAFNPRARSAKLRAVVKTNMKGA